MNDPQLGARLLVLDKYLANVTALPEGDEVKAHLCRFGAVLICGNIEQSVQIIILNRLRAKAHDHVLNFVRSHFKRGQNLDCEAIQQLLNRFDTGWYKAFSKFVEDNPDVKDGVSSCYAVRNSTSHGGTLSLGLKRLKELYEAHRKLIEGVVASTEKWNA